MMIFIASLFLQEPQYVEFETNYFLLRDDSVSLEAIYNKGEFNIHEGRLNEIFVEKSKSKGTVVAVNLGEQISQDRYSTSCSAMVYGRAFRAFEFYNNSKESGSILRGEESILSKQSFYGWKNSQIAGIFTTVSPESVFGKSANVGHISVTSRLLKEYEFTNEHNVFYSLYSVSETSEFLESAPKKISSQVVACVSGIPRQKNRIIFPQYPGRVYYYRLGYSKQRGHYADFQEVCKI
jgi:hypothetical protein